MTDHDIDNQGALASVELERELLLAAVRAREEFLEDILGSLEAFVTLDCDWRVTFANRSAAELAGLSDADIAGLDVRLGVGVSAGAETVELLERAMRERVPVEFDLDDRERQRVFRGRAYPLDDGGLAVYLRDVGSEKQARETEERLLALMDHNPSLIFLKDEEGRYVYLNRAYEERFAGRGDWRGKTDYDFWAPESAELFRANDAAVLASGEVQRFLEDSRGRDGERYCWLNYKFPFTDAQGRRFVGGIGIDVTDRVLVEEELRENRQLLQTVLAHSRDGINMLDLKTGRYVFMNEAQVGLTGFTAEEINGISAEEAAERVHPEDRHISLEQQRRVAAGEDDDAPVEYRWRVKTGEYRWFSDRRKIVRNAQGEPVALVGMSRDITRLKQEDAKRELQSLMLGGVASILEAALTAPTDERLGELCLQVAELLTESRFGFIGEVGDEGRLHDLALSDPGWRECAMQDQSGHRRLPGDFELHGLYGRVLLRGEPLLTNEPGADGESIGLPEGHPPLTSFLGVPLMRGEHVTGMIAVANNPSGYGQEHLQALQAIAPVVREAFDRRRAEEALRQNELLAVAQQERNRLARDLHDSVTQALFAATIKAEALTLDQYVSPGMASTAEEVRRLTRGALAQMRTLLLELRSEPVHEIPLQQLLRHLVEATESRASTSVRLTVRGDTKAPPEVHVMLYRVAQEALNNVARHARAQNAWVVVDLEPSSLRLVVGDDGVGFDPGQVQAGHLGLVSMRERADEAGATLLVTSHLGEGAEVVVEWRGPAEPDEAPSVA